MVRTVIEIYGRIDILFNNAGFGGLNWLERLEPDRDIETQIQVNLTGMILVTQAVLPHMMARRTGHIINMSSIAGWLAAPSYTVYAATKYGVRGFTIALRREVAPFGIHVSGVYPGPARTEFAWGGSSKRRVAGQSGLTCFSYPRRMSLFASWTAGQASAPRRHHPLVVWTDRLGGQPFSRNCRLDHSDSLHQQLPYPGEKMTTARLEKLNASLRTSGLDAVALNPGPTLTYLTGLHFHLMERPVVLLVAQGQDPAIVLPELEMLKVEQIPYPVQAFSRTAKTRPSGRRLFERPRRPSAWMGSGSASSRARCACWSSAMSKAARPKRTIPMPAMY
jgi:hypothetical protein